MLFLFVYLFHVSWQIVWVPYFSPFFFDVIRVEYWIVTESVVRSLYTQNPTISTEHNTNGKWQHEKKSGSYRTSYCLSFLLGARYQSHSSIFRSFLCICVSRVCQAALILLLLLLFVNRSSVAVGFSLSHFSYPMLISGLICSHVRSALSFWELFVCSHNISICKTPFDELNTPGDTLSKQRDNVNEITRTISTNNLLKSINNIFAMDL